MSRFRRLLIIIGFLALIILTVLLFWYLFFRPLFTQPGAGNVNGNVNAGGVLPNVNVNRPQNANQPLARGIGVLPEPAAVANGNLTLAGVVREHATAATIATDGSGILYYDSAQGRFVRFDPSTGTATLIGAAFPDVQRVTWSEDSTKAVLEFPDDRKVIYDFTAQRQYALPTAAQNFSFAQESTVIAYKLLGATENERLLITANIDGSGARAVTRLGDNAANVQVAWSPDQQVVGLLRQGLNAQQQEVILIGQQQENFPAITTNGRGFNGLWTPDGTKLLYTVYAEGTNWNPRLYLVQASGENTGSGTTDLGLSTFIEKCTFNAQGTHAYCAVPDALDPGSGILPELAASAKDSIFAITLATGDVRKIAQPVTDGLQRFSIGRVFLSRDESTLYFTERSSQTVQKLRLR